MAQKRSIVFYLRWKKILAEAEFFGAVIEKKRKNPYVPHLNKNIDVRLHC